MKTKEKLSKEIYLKDFEELCDDKKNIILTMLNLDNKEKDRFFKISKGAYLSLKIIILLILWAAFIFKLKWLVMISFLILFSSIFMKMRNNPIVFIYSKTLDRIIKTKSEFLDEKALRFANILGASLNFICIILLYFVNEKIGFIFLLIVAIIKTISTCGFCPGVKLYNCMNNGCCMFTRK